MAIALSGDVSEKILSKTARSLRDELALQPYVDVVNILGNRKEEISIELSETAMRRYGLNFDDVANAIGKNSINLSSGNIKSQTGTLQLATRNLGDSLEDFNNIIILQTPDGGKIKVSDVATVVDGFEDKDTYDALINVESGHSLPLKGLLVMSSSNMNVVKTSRSVNEWIESKQGNLPEGVSLQLCLLYTSDAADE